MELATKKASSPACENTRVVLVPCPTWKCVPKAISGGVFVVSEVPGCHLLRQMSSQSGSQKLLQGLVSNNSQPTFLFLTYLNLMNYGHIIKSM